MSCLITLLPMDEVRRLGSLKELKLTKQKKFLLKITKNIHGEEEAIKAQKAARSLFNGEQDADVIQVLHILDTFSAGS